MTGIDPYDGSAPQRGNITYDLGTTENGIHYDDVRQSPSG